MKPRYSTGSGLLSSVLLVALVLGFALPRNPARADEPEYTTDFMLETCKFKSRGTNPYFILWPRYQLVLEGEEDGEEIRVEITVLRETEVFDLEEIGKVRTRVVEEREWIDGELAEVSLNFFAICRRTNDVYYFGEDVDIYEDGEIVSHDGAWRAGENGALPGLIMPGTFLLGSAYYQEIAPGVALDKALHVDMGLMVDNGEEIFRDCVEVSETTDLDPDEESTKVYCPWVGLVQDDELTLVDYGFVKLNADGQ